MQTLSGRETGFTHWLCVRLLWLVLMFASSCEAEDLLALNLPPASARFLPDIITLSINHQQMPEAIVVLRDGENNWFLPLNTLVAARLHIPDFPITTYEGERYLALSAFADVQIKFDTALQALKLDLPPRYFVASQLAARARPAASVKAAEAGTGIFLNYDVSLDYASRGNGQAAFLELGGATAAGVGTTNFAFIRQPWKTTSLRLDTGLTIDQPEHLATLRLGDAISRSPTILGRPVRFGGVQYARNFLTQPDIVTTPMATLSGQAALPSTVDLFVNNVMQSRHEIAPGPFSISGVPLLAGDGELRMVVSDLAGRQQIISQRFYSSPTLLSNGLDEFSVEGGRLRKNFGVESNDYGDWFASGSYRRGMSDRLTLEAGAQVQQGSSLGALVSATSVLPGIGLASVALGYSHSSEGNGLQVAAGLERRTADYSVGISSRLADRQYRQLGVEPAFAARRLDSANFSRRIADIGSLGMSFVRQEMMGRPATEVIVASYSTPRKPWGNLIFTALQSRADKISHTFSLFWILPLERDLSATVSRTQTGTDNRTDQTVLQVQRSMPAGRGIGYRLQTGENVPNQASVQAQNDVGQARLDVAEFRGLTSARLGLAGGLANFDGEWFATRRITDSFGVVRLPGLNNVRVYVDNQLAAHTNQHGSAFLPRLHAYRPNHISVEALDLPMDTEIGSLLMQPIPAWRSGVVIEFPIRSVAAATLTLVAKDGSVVPAGAVAMIEGMREEFPIGREGQAYLTGLQEMNTVTVSWQGRHCVVRVPYAKQQGTLPDLGVFTCQWDAP